MKKFNFKTLLILAVVIILTLSLVLVACNKKKADPAPEPEPEPAAGISKAEYFTKMWNLASSIGGEAVGANDNLAVSLDASLKMMDMKNNAVEAVNLNIGLRLDLIIDRGNTAAHSAVRLGVYNGEDNSNFFEVYYFLDEPNFIYLDLSVLVDNGFLGEENRYFKIQFETDGNNNAAYTDPENESSVAGLIKNHKFGAEEGVEDSGFTIADILGAVANGTGSTWTLNTLVQNIADLFNLNLADLLGSIQGMLGGGIVDDQGKIHLENALSSKVVQGFIKTPKESVDANDPNRKVYSVDMNVSGLLTTIGSMLPEGIKKFINSQTDIRITYGEKNNAIDGFSIYLGIKSEKDKKTSIYPGFELSINELSIRKGPTSFAGVKEKVGFTASNWPAVANLNVNKMLNAEATMDIELYDKGVKTDYACTAYSDIDIISVVEGIIKITKAETPEARVAAFKAIHSEAGFKMVNKATQEVYFQVLASCPEAQLSWVIDGETTILDGADMLENIDTIIDALADLFANEEESAVQADDDEDGGFDIQALLDAFNLIKSKVTLNGKTGDDLDLDAIKAAFFNEDGELKEDWYKFTLYANFTEKDCDDLCKAFGGENASKIAVLIDKQEASLHLHADYENDAGVDNKGNAVRAMYYVDFTAEWDLEEHTLELTLDFNMWDDNEGKVARYICTYEGNLNIENELLLNGGAELRLTRQFADENSVTPIFDAVLEGEINYNQAKDSMTDANISLVVTNGLAESSAEFVEYFHIYGDLEVSGSGKLLVKFTDEGLEYVVTGNVAVDTYWRESLVEFICGLEVDGEAIKEIKLPASVREIFEITDENATVGDLLAGLCHINAEGENVIHTHYTRTVDATTHLETETFLIGLNEFEWDDSDPDHPVYVATGDTFHLAFEFRRLPGEEEDEYDVTYVKCVYDIGEGDTGLALKLDTWHLDKGGDYMGHVAPPSRTGATIHGADSVIDWIDQAMAFIAGFMA